MNEEVYCPRCKEDVNVNGLWDDVECPVCKLKGQWDEMFYNDMSDSYNCVQWEKFTSS